MLTSLKPTKEDQQMLDSIVESQASLQSHTELSPEEQLAVSILMKRNEKILIAHLQKMVEEANANKS